MILRRLRKPPRLTLLLLTLLLAPTTHITATEFDVPRISGDWWQVAGNPDLGKYTSDRQQPVDFGIWQAADGTWQIWSCIRGTKCGGNTRLFHCWEGKKLTDTDWKPKGIAMEADPSLGETVGGLQPPHVIKENGKYLMSYDDWARKASPMGRITDSAWKHNISRIPPINRTFPQR